MENTMLEMSTDRIEQNMKGSKKRLQRLGNMAKWQWEQKKGQTQMK